MPKLHFLEKGLGIVSTPDFTLLKGFELFQIWDCTLRNICNIHQVMLKNSSASCTKRKRAFYKSRKKRGKIGLLKWHSLVIQGKAYEYITRIYIIVTAIPILYLIESNNVSQHCFIQSHMFSLTLCCFNSTHLVFINAAKTTVLSKAVIITWLSQFLAYGLF